MPVYLLSRASLAFPDVEDAEPSGLLAVGGDLRPERLIAAYEHGVFPWYAEEYPILWWSPNPRLILEPERLHVSASLRRTMNKRPFRVTLDQAFEAVIRACAETYRPDADGTWIVPEMLDAYCVLHRKGYAHSVEAWDGERLVGGLYGVGLGGVFFGESMFHLVPDASKIAFVLLVRQLRSWGFQFIDCQQTTKHLLRFGAHEVDRPEFMDRLRRALGLPTRLGRWSFDASKGVLESEARGHEARSEEAYCGAAEARHAPARGLIADEGKPPQETTVSAGSGSAETPSTPNRSS